MMSTADALATLPLFHKKVVPLDAETHAALKLDRSANYGFSAASETIPIGTGEFASAAHSYPILFAGTPQPVPIVVLGFRKGWNLFVNEGGAWMPGAYVPALVRVYPFVFIHDADSGTNKVGIEEETPYLNSEKGLPLFEEGGKLSATLSEAITLCEACVANLADAAALGQALNEAGVLAEKDVVIEARTTGEKVRITGFRTVDPEKLHAVGDDVFLGWRRRQWLLPIYAHLLSAANWMPFTDLALDQMARRH